MKATAKVTCGVCGDTTIPIPSIWLLECQYAFWHCDEIQVKWISAFNASVLLWAGAQRTDDFAGVDA